jgi:hypothetical protein
MFGMKPMACCDLERVREEIETYTKILPSETDISVLFLSGFNWKLNHKDQ